MLFGKQLRTERERQKLTAQMLAEACGTSRSYITLMENGKRLPGGRIIPKIAEALNIKPEVVLNWYLEDMRWKTQNSLKS